MPPSLEQHRKALKVLLPIFKQIQCAGYRVVVELQKDESESLRYFPVSVVGIKLSVRGLLKEFKRQLRKGLGEEESQEEEEENDLNESDGEEDDEESRGSGVP